MPLPSNLLAKLLNFSPDETLGLFDSGIGGISILNQLIKLPIKKFIYIADTAHLPYGEKTPEFLFHRTSIMTHYLQENYGITTIVVACHTAAATTLETLRKSFPHITFIDPLPLTTQMALTATKNNKIGIFATQRSIASGIHKKLLLTQNAPMSTDLKIVEQACPQFVEIIEKHGSIEVIKKAVSIYSESMQKNNVDTLILGCTHYPFIESYIQQVLPHVTLISASSCIQSLVPNTIQHTAYAHVEFKTSGDLHTMQQLLEKYFNKKGVLSYVTTQLETPCR